MKTQNYIASAVLALTLLGCQTSYNKVYIRSEKAVPKALVGKWAVYNSAARYSITADGRQLMIEGFDSLDGERFVVKDAQWDGAWLRFADRMPSTGKRRQHALRFMDTDRLEGPYFPSGADGTEAWVRIIK